MGLTIDQLKEFTLFAKEHKIVQFQVGDCTITFHEKALEVPIEEKAVVVPEKSQEEIKKDLDEILMWSA
jgi:hypothetical protein